MIKLLRSRVLRTLFYYASIEAKLGAFLFIVVLVGGLFLFAMASVLMWISLQVLQIIG